MGLLSSILLFFVYFLISYNIQVYRSNQHIHWFYLSSRQNLEIALIIKWIFHLYYSGCNITYSDNLTTRGIAILKNEKTIKYITIFKSGISWERKCLKSFIFIWIHPTLRVSSIYWSRCMPVNVSNFLKLVRYGLLYSGCP